MTNLGINVNFDKKSIILTKDNQIFENLNLKKKLFFFHFYLVLQADLNVFLRCYKLSSILCARCPKIKNFMWDNTLAPKMIKSHLICICGHAAHFFLISPLRYRNFGSIEKKGGFASQFCVPYVRKSKKLFETTLWYLKW